MIATITNKKMFNKTIEHGFKTTYEVHVGQISLFINQNSHQSGCVWEGIGLEEVDWYCSRFD
jgi:hypothetical protein